MPLGPLEREVFELPARMGGMNVINPVNTAVLSFEASSKITRPLVEKILTNNRSMGEVYAMQQKTQQKVKCEKDDALKVSFDSILNRVEDPIQNRALLLAAEKGASNWLTVLPIQDQGFSLPKTAFRDAVALRYNWQLLNCPLHCACGEKFSIQHALSCPTGGYPSIRHNEIRDLTAGFLTEVCNSVSIEPHLQRVTDEVFRNRTAIRGDEARLDVAANGVWGGRFERAFFDIRVFNPSARSNSGPINQMYRKHEMEKKRVYEQRVAEVEHSSFTPLVFSTTGGMGKLSSCLYKRIASMMVEKNDNLTYSKTLWWMRCKLNFSLLRASLMCIRGARSSYQRPFVANIDLDLANSKPHTQLFQ